MPARGLTGSGHFLPSLAQNVLGECVTCRAIFEEAGHPELITLVPRAEGGGGLCQGCQRIFCWEHGALEEDGSFWCENCAYDKGMKTAEKAVLRVVFKGLINFFGGKDE